jgi:hypothetical protein
MENLNLTIETLSKLRVDEFPLFVVSDVKPRLTNALKQPFIDVGYEPEQRDRYNESSD